MTGCRDSCQKESITAPAIEPLSNDDYTENIELRGTYDFGIVKDQLILRPLNYYRHANDLQDAVYEREGDIAVVLYQLVKDSGPNLLTSKIKRVESKISAEIRKNFRYVLAFVSILMIE